MKNKIYHITVLLAIALSLLAGCVRNGPYNASQKEMGTGEDGTDSVSEAEYTEFSQLNGKTVSMLTGAPFEDLVLSHEPGVAEFTFFNNNEMNFARSISNRIFFMNEGGIYEDGTPEQIFEAPLKEKTRRFISRLKVLELEIHSRTYDFLGMQSELQRYCERNRASAKLTMHLQLAFEELVQETLIPALEKPDICISIDYSEETEKAVFTVRYGGEQYDPTSQEDQLSLAVLKGSTRDIRYTYLKDEELKNEITLFL